MTNLRTFLITMLCAGVTLLFALFFHHYILHVSYGFTALNASYISMMLAITFLALCFMIGYLYLRRGIYRWFSFQMGAVFMVFPIGLWMSSGIYLFLIEGVRVQLPLIQWPYYVYVLSSQLGSYAFPMIIGLSITSSIVCPLLFFIFRWLQAGQELGKARFADTLDIYRAGLLSQQGFLLAKSPYGLLRFPGYEPIIVVSGTGGGKTKSIAIPNLLELPGESVVVTDIKGEIYQKTHFHRVQAGNRIYRFEPGSKTTHRYNPLGLLRDNHIDEDLDTIFKTLIPDSHDPVWSDGSRNIAKMLTMYRVLDEGVTPTLQDIYQWMCRPNFLEEIEVLYDEVKTHRVLNLFGKFMSAREKTRRDLLLNAQEYLSKFDSPRLAYATGGNDFTFQELRERPTTIYLIIPANTETFGPICSIFFEQMLRVTTEKNEPDPSECTINAIIDEFANLPKMPSLVRGVSFLRSYRIRCCVFVQQISQLKAIYGEHIKEVFMASPVKLAFNITSRSDAEYFSRLAGKRTIRVRNTSSRALLDTSTSLQKQHRDLISPEELMRLKYRKLMIFRTGSYPIKAEKYFIQPL